MHFAQPRSWPPHFSLACVWECSKVYAACAYTIQCLGVGRARVKVCTAGTGRMHSVSVVVQRRWCDVLVQECICKSITLIRVRSSPGSIRCPPAPQLNKTKPRGPSCSPTAPRFCQTAGGAPNPGSGSGSGSTPARSPAASQNCCCRCERGPAGCSRDTHPGPRGGGNSLQNSNGSEQKGSQQNIE